MSWCRLPLQAAEEFRQAREINIRKRHAGGDYACISDAHEAN